MRRKIIPQKDSFTITLPKKWIKRYNVKEEVEVIEKDNTLEIRPSGIKEEAPKIKELDISKLPKFLFIRLVGACYKAGYDQLKIKCKPKQVKAIHTIVSELIGYEVIETNTDSLVIKRVVKSSPQQYYDSEKKCWHTVKAMSQDCLDGIKTNNKKALQEVIESDSIIDKFSDYCMHILQKYKDIESTNQPIPYLFVFQLEKVADLFVEMAKLALQKNLNQVLIDKHEKVDHYISSFYSAYYNFSFEAMKKLIVERQKLVKDLNKFSKKIKNPEQDYLICLKEIVDILSSLITPLLIKRT